MSHRALSWLRSLFLRRRQEREMGEEMGQHIERATSRLMARGLSQAEAERQAHREFGNMVYLQEAARDARGNRWVESIGQDLRYALRQFARTPLSTASMMIILSLGIGSSTGLFTLFNSMLTQPPLGVEPRDGLVRIRGRVPDGSEGGRPMSYPEVAALASQQGTFRAVAGYVGEDVVLKLEADEVFSGLGWYVSPEYFDVLDVRPALGSALPAAVDAENALVAIISDDMWREHFSGSAEVMGRAIRVNGVPVTIIGVAPPQFQGVAGSGGPRVLWMPLQARAVTNGHGVAFLGSRDSALFQAVAQLAPGATLERASQAAHGVAQPYLPQGAAGSAAAADVVPLLDGNAIPSNDNDLLVAGLMFGTLCLLIVLVTCANVSALLTGIAATRRREIAVRLTMGASRGRVVRQLLVESTALAIGAGAIALTVTTILLVAARRTMGDFPLALDWRMGAWTLGVALLTAVLFGMAPALHATRLSLGHVLKESANAVAGSRSLMQRVLVVVQVAVTQPLLVMVVAMVLGGVAHLRNQPDTSLNERLSLMSFNIGAGHVHPDVRRDEVLAVTERMRRLPGVVDVVPVVHGTSSFDVVVHPDDRVGAAGTEVIGLGGKYAAPGSFALRDIRLLAGREFTRDDEGAVIIDAALARELWGSSSPIGRRLVPASENPASAEPLVVVGVVEPPRGIVEQGKPSRSVYVHETEVSPSTILIRTQGPALAMLRTFRETATAAAPLLPVADVTTMAEDAAESRRSVIELAVIAGAGGLMALGLAALGLYAVMAQSVQQRRREIGIRSALGAGHTRVSGLFFRRGLWLTFIGSAIGLPFGVLAVSFVKQGADGLLASTSLPLATLLVVTAVVVVASLASWLPARAAARVDPVQALRQD
ncbi:MAG TPA: ABC transporter permease [Longimicrobiales bacterium]|nr:ABC transporter permease [Longimicrobiales bacterium]